MSLDGGFSVLASFDLPRGWKLVPLKYGATFRTDQLPPSTPGNYQFRYVEIGSVSYDKGVFEYTETTYAEAPSRARKLVSVGDTIVSTVRTYLRAIATISDDKDVVVSTGFAVIQPRIFDAGFLGYLAKSDLVCSEIEKRSWGVVYPAVNESQIGQIHVPVPPIWEQRRISSLLNVETAKIDRAVDLLRKQIETLEQLKKSLIYEVVTKGLDPTVPMKPSGMEWIGDIPSHWRVTRVKYVAPAWNGLTYDPADISDAGTPVLRSGNIQNGSLDLHDLVHVSSKVPEKAKAHTGDILICSRNGSRHLIGKNAIIRDEGFAFGAFMMIARPIIGSRYFHYLLNSGVFDFYLPTYLTSTVNQLTGTNFGNMVVPIVDDFEEQHAIVRELDARCEDFDLAIEKKRTQLSLLGQQKKSLVFEYVTGKRRVREVA